MTIFASPLGGKRLRRDAPPERPACHVSAKPLCRSAQGLFLSPKISPISSTKSLFLPMKCLILSA